MKHFDSRKTICWLASKKDLIIFRSLYQPNETDHTYSWLAYSFGWSYDFCPLREILKFQVCYSSSFGYFKFVLINLPLLQGWSNDFFATSPLRWKHNEVFFCLFNQMKYQSVHSCIHSYLFHANIKNRFFGMYSFICKFFNTMQKLGINFAQV